MSWRRQGGNAMHGRLRPLGTALAVLAVLLQLALAGRHGPVSRDAASSALEAAAAFGEHALCLASGGTPGPPGDETPTRSSGHDFTACCFWHSSPGFQLPAPPAVAWAAYVVIEVVKFAAVRQLAPIFRSGAVGARAPPVEVETILA